MRRFFTADWHLQHHNILKYCSRPFASVEVMERSLFLNFNQQVTAEDTVVHVGDFMMRIRDRDTSLGRTTFKEYRAVLPGHWVFVEGNHDRNNSVRPVASFMLLTLNGLRTLVSHYPVSDPRVQMSGINLYRINLALCGHVHGAWRTMRIMGIPHINVGVDVNRFRPLDDEDIIRIYQQTDWSKS